ncbi:hypothetical protein CBR_g8979 [Chara braunii]|uniref:Uncharacterized protein n=1 Tax=Chara braunii TaxID=69332 RepID=A0A388KNP3_CHABU|nr:hypothetical protein CBR_g8979 [Chara braunii]|eukprot:GBG71563.1 hypothetical protein CBR_g8979 [Chara braunii]
MHVVNAAPTTVSSSAINGSKMAMSVLTTVEGECVDGRLPVAKLRKENEENIPVAGPIKRQRSMMILDSKEVRPDKGETQRKDTRGAFGTAPQGGGMPLREAGRLGVPSSQSSSKVKGTRGPRVSLHTEGVAERVVSSTGTPSSGGGLTALSKGEVRDRPAAIPPIPTANTLTKGALKRKRLFLEQQVSRTPAHTGSVMVHASGKLDRPPPPAPAAGMEQSNEGSVPVVKDRAHGGGALESGIIREEANGGAVPSNGPWNGVEMEAHLKKTRRVYLPPNVEMRTTGVGTDSEDTRVTDAVPRRGSRQEEDKGIQVGGTFGLVLRKAAVPDGGGNTTSQASQTSLPSYRSAGTLSGGSGAAEPMHRTDTLGGILGLMRKGSRSIKGEGSAKLHDKEGILVDTQKENGGKQVRRGGLGEVAVGLKKRENRDREIRGKGPLQERGGGKRNLVQQEEPVQTGHAPHPQQMEQLPQPMHPKRDNEKRAADTCKQARTARASSETTHRSSSAERGMPLARRGVENRYAETQEASPNLLSQLLDTWSTEGLDDWREALKTVPDSSYSPSSNGFWKQVEPYFSFVSGKDFTFFQQEAAGASCGGWGSSCAVLGTSGVEAEGGSSPLAIAAGCGGSASKPKGETVQGATDRSLRHAEGDPAVAGNGGDRKVDMGLPLQGQADDGVADEALSGESNSTVVDTDRGMRDWPLSQRLLACLIEPESGESVVGGTSGHCLGLQSHLSRTWTDAGATSTHREVIRSNSSKGSRPVSQLASDCLDRVGTGGVNGARHVGSQGAGSVRNGSGWKTDESVSPSRGGGADAPRVRDGSIAGPSVKDEMAWSGGELSAVPERVGNNSWRKTTWPSSSAAVVKAEDGQDDVKGVFEDASICGSQSEGRKGVDGLNQARDDCEERLKAELRSIGLFVDEEVHQQASGEVDETLRILRMELSEQAQINRERLNALSSAVLRKKPEDERRKEAVFLQNVFMKAFEACLGARGSSNRTVAVGARGSGPGTVGGKGARKGDPWVFIKQVITKLKELEKRKDCVETKAAAAVKECSPLRLTTLPRSSSRKSPKEEQEQRAASMEDKENSGVLRRGNDAEATTSSRRGAGAAAAAAAAAIVGSSCKEDISHGIKQGGIESGPPAVSRGVPEIVVRARTVKDESPGLKEVQHVKTAKARKMERVGAGKDRGESLNLNDSSSKRNNQMRHNKTVKLRVPGGGGVAAVRSQGRTSWKSKEENVNLETVSDEKPFVEQSRTGGRDRDECRVGSQSIAATGSSGTRKTDSERCGKQSGKGKVQKEIVSPPGVPESECRESDVSADLSQVQIPTEEDFGASLLLPGGETEQDGWLGILDDDFGTQASEAPFVFGLDIPMDDLSDLGLMV